MIEIQKITRTVYIGANGEPHVRREDAVKSIIGDILQNGVIGYGADIDVDSILRRKDELIAALNELDQTHG